MLRRYTDRGHMSGVIRFDETNHETDHYSARSYSAIGHCFGSGEQVIKSLTTVGFTVDKAALIESPAFIQLRNRQRTNVISRTPCRGARLSCRLRWKGNFWL